MIIHSKTLPEQFIEAVYGIREEKEMEATAQKQMDEYKQLQEQKESHEQYLKARDEWLKYQPKPCPCCGRCPTCGRGGYVPHNPYPKWYLEYPVATYHIGSAMGGTYRP